MTTGRPGSPHESSDPDGVFVDELLRQTQQALGDPRIRFVHVRHAGPSPTADDAGSEPGSVSAAQRVAWAQTSALAATLRELWEHAWLPDRPTVAQVRYVDVSGVVRVEVTARSGTAEPFVVETATDRLVVRGFVPTENAPSPTRTHGRNGDREVVVDTTGGGVSMTLSAALDTDDSTTLDALVGLPAQVTLTPDDH